MQQIKTAAIVGMGALGLMYGKRIQDTFGEGAVTYVMDKERLVRHKDDVCTINGEIMQFSMKEASEMEPVDCVIVATKSTGLESALDVMAPAVGEHTIIISVLNGISSEEVLAERFGPERVLGCVAIGMDAMREGSDLQFHNEGRLQIGTLLDSQQEMLDSLAAFFEAIGQPYEVKADIKQAMWSKFLLNVGVNQACMVHNTTYGGVLESPEIKTEMVQAMREVLLIAEAEQVAINEENLQLALRITAGLNPEGYPSMRQDALAKRYSEVELFAGTVLRIAARHGIEVPVNRFYYNRIKETEAKYS